MVPGEISYSPRRSAKGPRVKYQRETITGFKLLARSRGRLQEVFVIMENSKRDEVKGFLRGWLR